MVEKGTHLQAIPQQSTQNIPFWLLTNMHDKQAIILVGSCPLNNFAYLDSFAKFSVTV